MNGVRTPDIASSNVLDEVVGNVTVGGVRRTRRASTNALAAQLATSGAITDLAKGASLGLVQTATWARLAAAPGERAYRPGRVTGPDAGTHVGYYADDTGAIVSGDTVQNIGEYSWSTSPAAWVRVGETDLTNVKNDINFLTTRVARPVGTLPIIVDKADMHGGGPAVYVPLRIFWGISGKTMIHTNLEPDPKFTNYHKVPITTTGSLQTVYLDIDDTDQPVKAAVYPNIMPVDPRRYMHLVSIYATGIVSEHNVEVTREQRHSAAPFVRGVAFDVSTRTLYISQLRGQLPDSRGFWYVTPPSGEYFRVINIGSSSGAVMIYVDLSEAVRDSTSPDAVRVVKGWSNSIPRPSRDEGGFFLLGIIFTDIFVPALGVNAAEFVPNMFGAGREDNDSAEAVYGSSQPVPLTRPESLALGFTRGYHAASPTSTSGLFRPYYGGYFHQPINSGRTLCQFYIETDIADDFGTPHAYLLKPDNSTTGISLQMMRKISPHLAQFTGIISMVNGETYDRIWCGGDFASDHARVFGEQFYSGPEKDPFISPRDYPRMSGEIGARIRRLEAVGPGPAPAAFDPIWPVEFFVHPERPYQVYLDQAFGADVAGRYRVSVRATPAGYAAPENIEINGGTLRLDAEKLGATPEIVIADRKGTLTKSSIFRPRLRKLDPTAVATLNFKMLVIGDSLSDTSGGSVQTVRRLEAMGATVQTIGTITQASYISGDGNILGEARSGKEFADFIAEHLDVATPVEAGGETAYLALSSNNRRNWNPFVRVATADDIANRPEMVFNGYIFDVRHYLTRFSFPDPDVVYINLHTNDISQQTPEESLAQIKRGLHVIVSQTRQALPNAKIVLIYNSLGRYATDERWETEHRAGLLEFIRFVRELADPDVHLVPAWCTVSRDAGFRITEELDPATGHYAATVSDAIHYGASGLREYGEVVAQYIAGIMTGA